MSRDARRLRRGVRKTHSGQDTSLVDRGGDFKQTILFALAALTTARSFHPPTSGPAILWGHSGAAFCCIAHNSNTIQRPYSLDVSRSTVSAGCRSSSAASGFRTFRVTAGASETTSFVLERKEVYFSFRTGAWIVDVVAALNLDDVDQVRGVEARGAATIV